MKQRSNKLALVAMACLVLATMACSVGESSRGWAAPVEQPNGNAIIVSTGKGRLDGIDKTSLQRSWRFPGDWSIPEESGRSLKGIYATPVLSDDGRTVFVGDYNGWVYAFRPSDRQTASGDQKPNAAALKLNGPVMGGMVLDSARDLLYVTAGDSLVAMKASDLERKIDNRDIQVVRTLVFKAEDEIWSKPVIRDGKIFVAALDGNLYAIEQTTGALAWRFGGTRALASTPVVAGSTLLVGGFDDQIHAVDIATGLSRWEFEASNWIWATPIVDGARIYVGDFDGKMYALDASDGDVVWSVVVADKPIVASPVLTNGVLVIAAQDGQIYAIDPSTQTRRWQQPADAQRSINADLVANGGVVYIAPEGCATPPDGTDKVYFVRLDVATGSLSSAGGVC